MKHLRKLLEPGLDDMPCLEDAAVISSAISLKRIADMLCGDGLPQAFQNVNAYGENFAVAIQEGLVRGQRGISQYDR